MRSEDLGLPDRGEVMIARAQRSLHPWRKVILAGAIVACILSLFLAVAVFAEAHPQMVAAPHATTTTCAADLETADMVGTR